ncbi:acyl-CoA dehydrogenase family protein [Nocardia sp. NPDC050793]|uniref:acyl-CoA dehydrogenase family protein n=1 Tax=Nocardia sp. NPDC050793 TaxID=3155159 RepID=UPI0033D6A840
MTTSSAVVTRQEWVDRAREVADRVLRPAARWHDQHGVLQDGVLPELATAGFFGMGVGREYSGSSAGSVVVGEVLEQLARVDMSPCYPILNAALIGSIIEANCSDEQRARWLPGLAAGDIVPALALTEEEYGTDAANISFRADRDGSGWILSGRKTSIMLAAYATHALVFTRTSDGGAQGVSAFFVALDQAGVHRDLFDDLGCRAGGRGVLDFSAVRVERSELVGAIDSGFVQVMKGFGYSRALICMMALGTAQAALDESVEFCRQRTTFGKPIGAHQGVSFPLVDAHISVTAARLLTLDALAKRDAGVDFNAATNMAKAWVPRVCFEAAHQALLSCGHRGWSGETGFGRRLRDLVGPEIADGTDNAARLVVARRIFGRAYAP